MKARHTHRVERVVRFDPREVESETEFLVDWEETDPGVADMDARETATLAFGGHTAED